MHMPDNCSVSLFSNAGFLVGVMDTQFLKSAPGLQISDEFAAKVFSPSVPMWFSAQASKVLYAVVCSSFVLRK
jgi:hypothetical protein